MKYSKELSDWRRKKLWGKFISWPYKTRKEVYNNSFEAFCQDSIYIQIEGAKI